MFKIVFYKMNCPIKDISVQECDATGDAITILRRTTKKYQSIFIRAGHITLFLLPLYMFAQSGHVTLQFKNVVGDKVLNADSVYTNSFGESFTVRSFRYYISNIILTDKINNQSQSFTGSYYLVDENVDSSKIISLITSLENISSIHFLLGVDSIKNVSGVQAGTLDPARGMFWTWNTGYVMAKLEGNSPVAKTPAHAFSFHVGGYKTNEQTARDINLDLGKNIPTGKDFVITVKADIMKWFNSVHNIKISEQAFCHEPGTLATNIADNYANMFTVIALQ